MVLEKWTLKLLETVMDNLSLPSFLLSVLTSFKNLKMDIDVRKSI